MGLRRSPAALDRAPVALARGVRRLARGAAHRAGPGRGRDGVRHRLDRARAGRRPPGAGAGGARRVLRAVLPRGESLLLDERARRPVLDRLALARSPHPDARRAAAVALVRRGRRARAREQVQRRVPRLRSGRRARCDARAKAFALAVPVGGRRTGRPPVRPSLRLGGAQWRALARVHEERDRAQELSGVAAPVPGRPARAAAPAVRAALDRRARGAALRRALRARARARRRLSRAARAHDRAEGQGLLPGARVPGAVRGGSGRGRALAADVDRSRHGRGGARPRAAGDPGARAGALPGLPGGARRRRAADGARRSGPHARQLRLHVRLARAGRRGGARTPVAVTGGPGARRGIRPQLLRGRRRSTTSAPRSACRARSAGTTRIGCGDPAATTARC